MATNVTPKNNVSFSSLTASVAASNPASTVAGDFLLAEVTARGATNSSCSTGGWTKIIDVTNNTIYKAVWRRFASSATDGQGTWTATGGTSIAVTIYGMTNVNTTTPVRFSSSSTSTNAITVAPSNLTGLQNNDEAFIFTGSDSGPQPWAKPGTGCVFGVMPNPTLGHWCSQAGIAAWETLFGRKMASGHSWAAGGATTTWDFSAGLPGSGSSGPNVDFANGRLSILSWFTENAPWPYDSTPTDPTVGLNAIVAGTHDAVILGNAQVLRNFQHPIIFRLFCEMNGGDHPYEIAYTKAPAANLTNWNTAFLAAWKRIWAITKGSDADIAAYAPGYSLNSGHSANALNAYFHWCPQTFDSTTRSRDAMYPGDKFVDLAGSEAYFNGTGSSFNQIVTDTTAGNSAGHVGAIAYFNGAVNSSTPGWQSGDTGSAGGIPCANGEAGLRFNGFSGDTAALAAARISSILSGLKANHGWAHYSYWDGGGTGNSAFTGAGAITTASIVSAMNTVVNDPWLNPILDVSYKTPTGWNEILQYRTRLGGADTNIGAKMAGSQSLHKTSTGSSVTAPSITGFGFGNYAALSIALVPGGSVTNPSAAYPNPAGTNYNEFSGLPSTIVSTYTTFDGVVDPLSQANTEENRAARAMVTVGNVDYWGGSFTLATSPGGSQVTRTNLAAVDSTTGALLSFNPTFDGAVRGLGVSPDSNSLYVVGDFTHVNGVVRSGCAKFAIPAGTLDTSWVPSANNSVRSVAISADGNTAYLSGNFTTINGSARIFVAAVNTSTGALSSSFTPTFSDSTGNAQAEVRKVRFAPGDNTHLYAVGFFDTIVNGAISSPRIGIARLNLDGSVDTWHPDTVQAASGDTIGHDICFKSDGSECYAAFAGSDSSGDGNKLIAYTLTPSALNTRKWQAVLDGDCNACDTNDTYVWGGTHGDGTQNLSVISNVGSKKIVCVRTLDGSGSVNASNQKTSLWFPNPQFNGIKGTYVIVAASNALKLGGTWSTPNQSASSFSTSSLQEFTIGTDNLTGQILNAGMSATVIVNFSPAVLGKRTATLTINDNSGGSATSQNVVLNGNGVISAPIITTNPASSIDFGNVQLINTSTSATFTFTDATPGVTFLGSLDGGPFNTVTSPLTYSGLTVGSHTFSIKAHNAAGDSPITSYTWQITS